MFSTLTAITGRRLTRPPVSGSTGLALTGLLAEGLGVGDSGPLVVEVGSGATPGSSRVAAKPTPPATRTAAVAAATTVCARFHTKVLMVEG